MRARRLNKVQPYGARNSARAGSEQREQKPARHSVEPLKNCTATQTERNAELARALLRSRKRQGTRSVPTTDVPF